MITLGKPFVVRRGEESFLKAKIDISKDTVKKYMALKDSLPKTHWRFYENYPPASWKEDGCLWFSVNSEYEKFFCIDRSDAFVVAMLWYAMMTESDIQFQTPISEKLYFGITSLLIPAVCKNRRKIALIGSTINNSISSENAVATGMSCGVDSLYSLQKYSSSDIPESFRLTNLTYFNMGVIFHPNTAINKKYSIKEFYSETDRMSLEKLQNALEVAKKHNLPLVYIASNLDKDYYRGAYGYTGVYRNCAMVLSLQGLF